MENNLTECHPIECPECGAHAYCTLNLTDTSQMICNCEHGFEGDPYIECQDINECEFGASLTNNCSDSFPVQEKR